MRTQISGRGFRPKYFFNLDRSIGDRNGYHEGRVNLRSFVLFCIIDGTTELRGYRISYMFNMYEPTTTLIVYEPTTTLIIL